MSALYSAVHILFEKLTLSHFSPWIFHECNFYRYRPLFSQFDAITWYAD